MGGVVELFDFIYLLLFIIKYDCIKMDLVSVLKKVKVDVV